MRILDKHQVKATFFMIGERMEKYPEIVKEAVAQGHAVGNHTYSHPHDLESLTSDQVIRELDDCEQVIERMVGHRTHLFRPPRGLLNGTVLRIAKDERYRTILWTVSADHHDAPTPEAMAARVLKHAQPGAIILAHDGTFASRINDVRATPLIIEELKRQGYRFVTVPELLEAGGSRGAGRARGRTATAVTADYTDSRPPSGGRRETAGFPPEAGEPRFLLRQGRLRRLKLRRTSRSE